MTSSKFIFENRQDLIHEILHGSHAHNLRAFECSHCHRIHVRINSPMMTPFSNPKHIQVPADIVLDVDHDWKENLRRDAHDLPICPLCSLPMLVIKSSS